eukprot:TRINITY_DN66973_c9_g1_i1.p1 TRINITY_DN66973_c9_g1~~TRINITY_DN66973_c9_g1_i1.p1  ORF type:complete len:968 (-),score=138.13 TRINITY_DN66973_c9_g1_i1:30-2693(-)
MSSVAFPPCVDGELGVIVSIKPNSWLILSVIDILDVLPLGCILNGTHELSLIASINNTGNSTPKSVSMEDAVTLTLPLDDNAKEWILPVYIDEQSRLENSSPSSASSKRRDKRRKGMPQEENTEGLPVEDQELQVELWVRDLLPSFQKSTPDGEANTAPKPQSLGICSIPLKLLSRGVNLLTLPAPVHTPPNCAPIPSENGAVVKLKAVACGFGNVVPPGVQHKHQPSFTPKTNVAMGSRASSPIVLCDPPSNSPTPPPPNATSTYSHQQYSHSYSTNINFPSKHHAPSFDLPNEMPTPPPPPPPPPVPVSPPAPPYPCWPPMSYSPPPAAVPTQPNRQRETAMDQDGSYYSTKNGETVSSSSGMAVNSMNNTVQHFPAYAPGSSSISQFQKTKLVLSKPSHRNAPPSSVAVQPPTRPLYPQYGSLVGACTTGYRSTSPPVSVSAYEDAASNSSVRHHSASPSPVPLPAWSMSITPATTQKPIVAPPPTSNSTANGGQPHYHTDTSSTNSYHAFNSPPPMDNYGDPQPQPWQPLNTGNRSIDKGATASPVAPPRALQTRCGDSNICGTLSNSSMDHSQDSGYSMTTAPTNAYAAGTMDSQTEVETAEDSSSTPTKGSQHESDASAPTSCAVSNASTGGAFPTPGYQLDVPGFITTGPADSHFPGGVIQQPPDMQWKQPHSDQGSHGPNTPPPSKVTSSRASVTSSAPSMGASTSSAPPHQHQPQQVGMAPSGAPSSSSSSSSGRSASGFPVADPAVIVAIAGGDLATLKDYAQKPNFDVNAVDEWHCGSLLHNACKYSHKEVVRELLAMGANINAKTPRGVHQGWTPLDWGVFAGDLELVELLITNGAELQLDDLFSKVPPTMLHGANKHGIVEYLKGKGGASPQSF